MTWIVVCFNNRDFALEDTGLQVKFNGDSKWIYFPVEGGTLFKYLSMICDACARVDYPVILATRDQVIKVTLQERRASI
jgi:hypothetical protein